MLIDFFSEYLRWRSFFPQPTFRCAVPIAKKLFYLEGGGRIYHCYKTPITSVVMVCVNWCIKPRIQQRGIKLKAPSQLSFSLRNHNFWNIGRYVNTFLNLVNKLHHLPFKFLWENNTHSRRSASLEKWNIGLFLYLK